MWRWGRAADTCIRLHPKGGLRKIPLRTDDCDLRTPAAPSVVTRATNPVRRRIHCDELASGIAVSGGRRPRMRRLM